MFQFYNIEYLVLICVGVIVATTVDNVWCITNDALPVTESIVREELIATTTDRIGDVEGRQSGGVSFFPTGNDPTINSNQLDYNNYKTSPDASYLNNESPEFKFSQDNRQNYQNQLNLGQSSNRPQFSNQNFYNPNQPEVFKFSQDNRQSYQNPTAAQQSNFPSPPPSDFYNSGEYFPANNNFNKPQRRPPTPIQTQSPSANNYAQYYNYQPLNQRRRPSTSSYPNPYYQQYYQQPYAASSSPYAGNYNYYKQSDDNENLVTTFLDTLRQGASGLFSGGGATTTQEPNAYYGGQVVGLQRPQNSAPGVINPVNQFGKAIDGITKNDDLQCIPKIICQMVGGQKQQNMMSPLFSALIAAVPSASSGLTYGRAALLGYTSGEKACDSAYPKCPRNEDDLLYYLNNHKGGFFRFFNSGGAFGQDTKYQYNPNPQNYGQQIGGQQQQLSSTLQNLAFIQSLANTVNESGGINLSNLGANAGLLSSLANAVSGAQSGSTAVQPSYDQSAATTVPQGINIGDLVGNLLTGVVGNRFSQRRISKRSIDTKDYVKEEDNEKEEILSDEDDEDTESSREETVDNDDEIEGRILNHKNTETFVSFPSMKPNLILETNRQVKFLDHDKGINNDNPVAISFPAESHRVGKKITYDGESGKFFPEISGGQQFVSNIEPHRTKMIFPDRTGTGNLKFDNEDFESNNNHQGIVSGFRKGKILTGIRQIGIPNENYEFRPTTVNYGNNQEYQNQNYYQQSAISAAGGNNYNNRPLPATGNGEDVSKNVYVTNAHGVVEYYIKDGQKIFV